MGNFVDSTGQVWEAVLVMVQDSDKVVFNGSLWGGKGREINLLGVSNFAYEEAEFGWLFPV